jgi:RHS repeat-associated protein
VHDQSGKLLHNIGYMPYGGQIVLQGDETSQFGFNGKERELQSGLLHFGARYYDPVTRQFISVDPLLMQGAGHVVLRPEVLHPYTFGASNPTSNFEENGTYPWGILGYVAEYRRLRASHGPKAGHIVGYNFVIDTFHTFVPGADTLRGVMFGQTHFEARRGEAGSGRAINAVRLGGEVLLQVMTSGAMRAPAPGANRLKSIGSTTGTPAKAGERTWRDFLPEAKKRVEAVKAEYGDHGLTMMARKSDIKQVDKIVRKLNMSKEQRRLLHDEITRQDLTIDEIMEIAHDIMKHMPKGGR